MANFLVIIAKNYDAVNRKPLNKSCGSEFISNCRHQFFLFVSAENREEWKLSISEYSSKKHGKSSKDLPKRIR